MGVVHLNENNFEKEVMESDIPAIIDFFADWCGPCQMMGPEFEKLSGQYEGKLKFCKLNTDENQELAAKFDISGIPCLVMVKKGEEIGRFVGFMPGPMLKDRIDGVLK